MTDDDLLLALAGFEYDPLGWVQYSFPWGEPGTILANASGPEPWQITILQWVRDGLLSLGEAIRLATASGPGVG